MSIKIYRVACKDSARIFRQSVVGHVDINQFGQIGEVGRQQFREDVVTDVKYFQITQRLKDALWNFFQLIAVQIERFQLVEAGESLGHQLRYVGIH